MEGRIGGLDIWYWNARRVICKGPEMIEEAFHAVERRSFVLW